MSDDAEVLRVAREWVAKAENDLRAAAHTLKLESKCPTDTVCFHAQQCAEKYIKALLVLRSIPFLKTHDLGVLAHSLPEAWQPDLSPEQIRRLTDYATITRYPGDYEPVTLTEARAAIALARKIRKHARGLHAGWPGYFDSPRSSVSSPATPSGSASPRSSASA